MQEPALLTLHPQRRLGQLQELGLKPRLLAFQPALRRPERGRWQLLPPAPPRLTIDLSGLGVITTAMLLSDLRRAPGAAEPALVFLAPRGALAARRLLAMSGLRCAILPLDAPAELLTVWLRSPLDAIDGQVWVKSGEPELPVRSPHLVPLLAALAHAETVPQAAGWCDLSGRRAYEVLAEVGASFSLLYRPRRHARQWAAALNRALGRPLPTSKHPRKEHMMDEHHPLEVIAANLCGCVIERIRAGAGTATLDLDEPRQGRLTLVCQGATLLNALEEYADLAERSAWERRVDWADLVASDIVAIYLADERCLLLRLEAGRFERAEARR